MDKLNNCKLCKKAPEIEKQTCFNELKFRIICLHSKCIYVYTEWDCEVDTVIAMWNSANNSGIQQLEDPTMAKIILCTTCGHAELVARNGLFKIKCDVGTTDWHTNKEDAIKEWNGFMAPGKEFCPLRKY